MISTMYKVKEQVHSNNNLITNKKIHCKELEQIKGVSLYLNHYKFHQVIKVVLYKIK